MSIPLYAEIGFLDIVYGYGAINYYNIDITIYRVASTKKSIYCVL